MKFYDPPDVPFLKGQAEILRKGLEHAQMVLRLERAALRAREEAARTSYKETVFTVSDLDDPERACDLYAGHR
jgi:hypothetical protein